jgi:hypothetical protein
MKTRSGGLETEQVQDLSPRDIEKPLNEAKSNTGILNLGISPPTECVHPRVYTSGSSEAEFMNVQFR